MVAGVYVCLDTAHKTERAFALGGTSKAVAVGAETLVWQLLASVFWPGSLIRCVVAATALATAAAAPALEGVSTVVGLDLEQALPTVAGLAAIPFIVAPIDKVVDLAMEASLAKALHGRLHQPAEWATATGVLAAACAVPPVLFQVATVLRAAHG